MLNISLLPPPQIPHIGVVLTTAPGWAQLVWGSLQELAQGAGSPVGKAEAVRVVVLCATLRVLNHLCQQVSLLYP